MRVVALLGVALAASALTGCGGNQLMLADVKVPLTAYKCTYEADCVITVFVTNTNPCVVTVDREEIEMKGSYTTTGLTHLIRWELDEDAVEAKFRFDPNIGVKLKSTSTDPDGQFSGQGPKGKRMQFHWRDRNTNFKDYEYEINVVQKITGLTCRKDPKIYNN